MHCLKLSSLPKDMQEVILIRRNSLSQTKAHFLTCYRHVNILFNRQQVLTYLECQYPIQQMSTYLPGMVWIRCHCLPRLIFHTQWTAKITILWQHHINNMKCFSCSNTNIFPCNGAIFFFQILVLTQFVRFWLLKHHRCWFKFCVLQCT